MAIVLMTIFFTSLFTGIGTFVSCYPDSPGPSLVSFAVAMVSGLSLVGYALAQIG